MESPSERLADAAAPDATQAFADDGAAAGLAQPAPAELPRVEGYELLEVLGRGGMGVVYKARQLGLKRLVALKMIRSAGHAGADERKRFRAEAESAARLQHANIVQIYEIGEAGDVPFLSLEYIDGGSLATHLHGEPQPAAAAARLVHTLAQAMHYAHGQGVVHRDLKPANILLVSGRVVSGESSDGAGGPPLTTPPLTTQQPKIADFGLAKQLDDDSAQTRSGAVLGTPSYMAPEQALGRSKDIGAAADVYALGAILYEMLTGRPPFKGASVLETLEQVRTQEAVPPRRLQPRLPRDLETICLRCLHKEPAKRYAGAAALAEDLRRFLAGEPILARPVGPIERGWRWCRRNPIIASLAGLVLLVLVLGIVISSTLAIWATVEKTRADREADKASREAAEARTARDAAQKQTWQARFEQIKAERLAGGRWRALELLAAMPKDERLAELRQEAIQAVTSGGAHRVHVMPFGFAERVAFSADGRLLVVSGNAVVHDENRSSNAVRTRFYTLPSGDFLGEDEHRSPFALGMQGVAPAAASCTAKDLTRIWKPLTGEEIALIPDFGTLLPARRSVLLGPECRLVALHHANETRVWTLANKPQVVLRTSGAPVAFLSEDQLIVRQGDRLGRVQVSTGNAQLLTPAAHQPLAVSADGRVAALKSSDAIVFWDLQAGKAMGTAVKPLRGVLPSAGYLSDDGRWFASRDPAAPTLIELWDTATGRGRLLAGLSPSNEQGFASAAFHPHEALFAAEGGNDVVRIWDLQTGREVAALHNRSAPVWSGDGRWLALLAQGAIQTGPGSTLMIGDGKKGIVEVWQVATPAPTYTMAQAVTSLVFSRDGKQLAANTTLWELDSRYPRSILRETTQRLPGQFAVRAPDAGWWSVEFQGSDKPIRLSTPGGARSDFELPPPRHIVKQRLAFSPDRRLVLVPGSKVVPIKGGNAVVRDVLHLWDLTTGRRLAEWQTNDQLQDLQFSPDGTRVAAVGNNQLKLWEVATGKMLHHLRFPGSPPTRCVVFSPDGKRVFAGAGPALFATEFGAVVVGDVETGRELDVWRGHTAEVLSLAVSPDGKLLASGSKDRTVRLWEVATGRALSCWQGHEADVTALAFHPDGQMLVSGSSDGTLRLWSLPQIRAELGRVGLDW